MEEETSRKDQMVASAGTTPGESEGTRQTAPFSTPCRNIPGPAPVLLPALALLTWSVGQMVELGGRLSAGTILQIKETDPKVTHCP